MARKKTKMLQENIPVVQQDLTRMGQVLHCCSKNEMQQWQQWQQWALTEPSKELKIQSINAITYILTAHGADIEPDRLPILAKMVAERYTSEQIEFCKNVMIGSRKLFSFGKKQLALADFEAALSGDLFDFKCYTHGQAIDSCNESQSLHDLFEVIKVPSRKAIFKLR